MRQVKAYVESNSLILPGLARSPSRSILGSHLVRLHCPEIAREAKPGQFVMVRCGEGAILPRPFSIHQVIGEDIAIFLAVLEDGKGTNWLALRQENEAIELFGPLGNGFSLRPGAKNLLLVAGGIGVAPLCFLAQEAVRKRRSVTLLLGAATAAQLYPENLLPSKIRMEVATEDGTAGRKGRVTKFIPDFIDGADQVFACGPMPMYREMSQQRGKLLEGKPAQISLEVVMGCGRGVCYGCTIKTKDGLKEVCTDGPVFNLDEVLWDELGLS